MYRVEVKKITNTDKFRPAAVHFTANGRYTAAPKGTTAFYNYWDEETRRCLDGFTTEDGDFISGYFYFYLNYCQIYKLVLNRETGKNERVLGFPDYYDYDKAYFDAIEEAEKQGKHLVVIKKRGAGYEQPYSEIVITPDGETNMGSLKVGDWIMNPCGSATEVEEIIEQGEQEVYKVVLQDNREVTCGANHLWSIYDRRRNPVTKTTLELSTLKLKQGSKNHLTYGYKIPGINPIQFEKKSVKVDPYVLGVLIGDGTLKGSQIKFSTDDKEIVEELAKRLPGYEMQKSKYDKFQYTIVSDNRRLNQLNRDIGELGLKTLCYYKFIPDNYKYSSIEDRFELVRGLLDTDGSITNGSIRFSNTSERLIDDLAYVLRSLGIRCRKSKKQKIIGKTKFPNGYESETQPFWVLVITTGEDVFKLSRKRNKIKKYSYYDRDSIGIKEITKLDYKEKQRCIIVSNENHLYLTRNFIPTHNSFKGGSMLCRNFYLIPGSKSYAIAAEQEFLTKDGLLTKAWEIMDFIDEHTAWYKKRQKVDTKLHKRASAIIDKEGVKVEIGYKSEIIGITLKNDINKAVGKRGKLILWEEGGKFSGLKTAWLKARPSVEDTDHNAFGLMVAYGTGGSTKADYEGLKDLFYEPDAYNCLPIENIWDDGANEPSGFFVPQYYNMGQFMDSDGNSDVKAALEFELKERDKIIKNATDRTTIDRYVSEQPFTPAEACLVVSINIFPKAELIKHLGFIRTNKKVQEFKQVGKLVYDEVGLLKWQQSDKPKDLTKYRVDKSSDPSGEIVIWEHPIENPPYGLYIAACDPYDHDQSNSGSLGSTFIYKRFQKFESYYDIIVAEYTGRPEKAEMYYENVKKLLQYYSAKLLYENQNPGLATYFRNNHFDYLLADQPDIIDKIIKNSIVNRAKGIHMSKEIKAFGEGLAKDWLITERSEGRLGLHTLLSEPLLEELIAYNDKGNYDRVIAFFLIMIYKEELFNIKIGEKKDFNKTISFFDKGIYTYNTDTYLQRII